MFRRLRPPCFPPTFLDSFFFSQSSHFGFLFRIIVNWDDFHPPLGFFSLVRGQHRVRPMIAFAGR